jgi:hypothetical protein
MKPFLGLVFALSLLVGPARADDAKDVLDRAIKAVGGQDKLDKIKAISWKTKGTITINGTDSEFTSQATAQGLDKYRSEAEADLGGNKVKILGVVNGDKGWGKFGDMGMAMDKDRLANEKRSLYVMLTPVTLVPLAGKGFKIELAGEEKVGDSPAVVLKVTGPDGKDFKIFFHKKTNLPIKVVAQLKGFMGEDVTQETIYGEWKEMGGIKKATKIESKRDGEKFINQTITEFKILDKVDEKTFAEPE